MSTQLQTPFVIPATRRAKYSPRKIADRTLKAAAAFWFIVVVLGELIFATTVASFYGLTAVRGNWQQWNKSMTHGYTPGRPMANLVDAIHLASAVIILLSGALQLIPVFRRRAPLFHRWNGRVYMVTAFTVSLAGLWMIWIRGTVGDLSQHLGQSLDAVLIMLCSVLALRYALLRDFKTHRRWALRLFMVVSASLFIRAGIFLSLVLNHGPFGFNADTFSGPDLKQAYDSRKSIAETLSATIATSGIDQAAQQYRQLRVARASTYNLDEDELNILGYELVKANKLEQAVRIFQLNVEAYPNSGNTYDSLAEGYMDEGNKLQAIANYKRSLQLNPANNNAVKMLRKLNAP
jgi:uncharacterized membrane protein